MRQNADRMSPDHDRMPSERRSDPVGIRNDASEAPLKWSATSARPEVRALLDDNPYRRATLERA
jgi:hypothetical protein